MDNLCKILIVDDEKDFCDLLKENLESLGQFQVSYEIDPQRVEAAIEASRPDIILLDNVMPTRKGSEIVRELKKQEDLKRIPIIMVSGRGEMVYYKKSDSFKWEANRPIVKTRGEISQSKNPDTLAEEYGVDFYISKPVTTEAILEVINDILKRKGMARPSGQEGAPGEDF